MAKFKRVPTSRLPVGAVLNAPVNDPSNSGVRLLNEGVSITQDFVNRLFKRGIVEIAVSSRDAAMMASFKPQGRRVNVPDAHQYVQSVEVNDHSKEIDELLHREQMFTLEPAENPVRSSIQRPREPFSAEMSIEWAANNDRNIETLGEFYADSFAGGSAIEPIRNRCQEIIKQYQEDPDALVCLAASPYESEYPSRHGIHLTSMAIALGVEMGLDESSLVEMGVGCLLHDVGMQRIGLHSFQSKSPANHEQLRILSDHPVESIAFAGQFGDSLSMASKMVAYQIHERLDGSGYPRGRQVEQIHPLAKIASVADAFVGMLSPRPHRLGIQGHFVVRHILEQTQQGKFDPKVVRALLRVTTLYPIGSCVELNGDRVARVIRSNGADYDKPMIEMWESNNRDADPTIVNLKEETEIRITGPIPHFDVA